MAKVNLGRIGFVPRGNYSNNEMYVALDVVRYNGSAYCCIKDTPASGVLPSNSEYFVLLVERGDPGPQGVGTKGEKGDALRFEDLTPEQVGILQSKSSGGYLSFEETIKGVISISGKEYTLYEMLVEIASPPKTANEEATFVIQTKPLGFNSYLKVESLVAPKKTKTAATDYYNSSYQVTRLFVDSDLNTKVSVKCLSTVTDDIKLILHVEYVKDYGEVLELEVTVPAGISPSAVNLTFPKLKYNKYS